MPVSVEVSVARLKAICSMALAGHPVAVMVPAVVEYNAFAVAPPPMVTVVKAFGEL